MSQFLSKLTSKKNPTFWQKKTLCVVNVIGFTKIFRENDLQLVWNKCSISTIWQLSFSNKLSKEYEAKKNFHKKNKKYPISIFNSSDLEAFKRTGITVFVQLGLIVTELLGAIALLEVGMFGVLVSFSNKLCSQIISNVKLFQVLVSRAFKVIKADVFVLKVDLIIQHQLHFTFTNYFSSLPGK